MENVKLYRVFLKGGGSYSSTIDYSVSYVVAVNSHEAYKKVRDYLDHNDLLFRKNREMDKVELIADISEYNDVGCLLFL